MSVALNKAIYKRLTDPTDVAGYPEAASDQAALIALLGKDRDETDAVLGPSVTFGTMDDKVEFPQITFRGSGGSEPIKGVDIGIRVDALYDFEIWHNKRQAGIIEQINEYLEHLLDLRFGKAPVLTLVTGSPVTGKCFWMEAFTELSVNQNVALNSYFGLRRFMFVEARVY